MFIYFRCDEDFYLFHLKPLLQISDRLKLIGNDLFDRNAIFLVIPASGTADSIPGTVWSENGKEKKAWLYDLNQLKLSP